MPQDRTSSVERRSDPYRAVVLALLGASVLGGAAALAAGIAVGNPVTVDAALASWLAAGMLMGVAWAHAARAAAPRPRESREAPASGSPAEPEPKQVGALGVAHAVLAAGDLGELALVAMAIGSVGGFGVLVRLLGARVPRSDPPALATALGVGLALAAAGLAGLAARYLAAADAQRLPEAPGLSRGARVLAWIFAMAGLALGLAWAGYAGSVSALHGLALILIGCLCFQLFRAGRRTRADAAIFPTDLGALSLLGSRANPLASMLDTARSQLGIDLRSTWALTVVRRSAEPLFIACVAIGWLSTTATVVGLEEQGLVERLGVPLVGARTSGVHMHWPWPIDRVARVDVLRVRTLPVGHEEEAESGPEDVLWARQHGGTEYTLLLGDGRDLIAVDAAVHFRISDAHAWLYGCQNPTDALRAIAYRAVMQATVGRTLAEALSENVAALTAQMRAAVQTDSDALGLGVEVVGFTVGGMHPPVRVAGDYQAVVSAELGKATAAIAAKAYRNEIVPAAEAEVVARANAARAEGAEALGKAAGEAWSFRALESEYRAAPQEYRFRRRLETLESGLGGRHFTVLDARVQRDGGELWLMK
jgi:membrane protease subunit HflK